jgi:proteasome beta subunit
MRPPTESPGGPAPGSLGADSTPVFGPEIGEFPETDRTGEAGDQELKTGTTTVGVSTDEGVVLATDMRASAGNMVSSKDVQKVEEIHPTGALTIAGSVSAAQSLIRSLRAEVRLYGTRRGEQMSMEALSTLTANFLRSGAFFIVAPLLGGVDDDGTHVYSLDPLGGMTQEEYAVSGSGSQYALGVLEREYEGVETVTEARTVAARAIDSAVERDLASGNGLNVAEVTEEGVTVDRYKEFEELL